MTHHGSDGDGRPLLKLPAHLLELCRQLRQSETPAENILWACLRDRRLGYKFRRQHVFGSYIADFYCQRGRLIVELDGSVHEDRRQAEYDVLRQREIEGAGIEVLRFSNDDVKGRLPMVLETII